MNELNKTNNKVSTMKPISRKAAKAAKSIQGKTFMVFAFLLLAMPMNLFAAEAFFDAVGGHLSTIVALIGGGLAVWGVVNLVEGYGNDNPGAKSQGMKQLMAGVGLILIGFAIPTLLAMLF